VTLPSSLEGTSSSGDDYETHAETFVRPDLRTRLTIWRWTSGYWRSMSSLGVVWLTHDQQLLLLVSLA